MSSPGLVLVQPNGVGVSGDEFLDWQAVDRFGTANPLLLAQRQAKLFVAVLRQ
jgi:hypothetical protein